MRKYNEYIDGKKEFFGSLIEAGSDLSFSVERKKVVILGNKEGLITLAKHLIDFANDSGEIYGNELHLYPSDEISLEALSADSLHVYIRKK